MSYFQQRQHLSLEYRIAFAEYDVIPKTYYQLIIEFLNTGNHSIRPDAYHHPFRIQFAKDAQVFRGEIVHSKPAILQTSIPKMKGNAVEIDKLLFNSRDSIKVEIWLHNFDQTLSISSHIADVRHHSIFPFFDSDTWLKNRWKTWWHKVRRQRVELLSWLLLWGMFIPLLLISMELFILQGQMMQTLFGDAFLILNEPWFYLVFNDFPVFVFTSGRILAIVLLVFLSFLRRIIGSLIEPDVNQRGYNMQPENIELTNEYRLTNINYE